MARRKAFTASPARAPFLGRKAAEDVLASFLGSMVSPDPPLANDGSPIMLYKCQSQNP